ncbi:DUF3592 domain-containing protein [Ketobacter alkanivorans]|uniref:DUF3592 domain-containing protein n=1 Tax=Ketobacter alkanivorans TaxID=1917421 RepID=A0A2K9LNB7_9GAMM|nr:DUF3592 domain-containing protein [Ketobacter alkanivorans]AUM12284.1 hypothetical protein Kalk_07600 [Ketobacter alkanivorans]
MGAVDYFESMWGLALNGQAQGVFFFASLYALVMLLYSLRFQVRVSSLPGVEGELEDERIREFGYAYAMSQKEYVVSVSYKYVVEGKEYVGNRLSPWAFVTNNNARFILKSQLNSICRGSSGKITVYYDPEKPHKSFLIKPGLFGKSVTGLLAIMPLAMYWLKYYS